MTPMARRANCSAHSSASSPTRCASFWDPTGRPKSMRRGRSCSARSTGSLPESKRNPGWFALIPLQEVRADVGLLPDGVVVAEHAVGHQRVAGDHRVLVELTEFNPTTEVFAPVFHLNGVDLFACSQA